MKVGKTTNQPKNATQKKSVPTWVTANERIRRMSRSNSGAGWVVDRRTNNHSRIKAPTTETALAGARQARALDYIAQYWEPGVSPPRFAAVTNARGSFAEGPVVPADSTVIDGDSANVLVTSPAAGGCRRNITIMLTDGHGGDSFNRSSLSTCTATTSSPNASCVSNGGAANRIYQQSGGANVDLASITAWS